jgi:DNA topoisomerase IB-like protein
MNVALERKPLLALHYFMLADLKVASLEPTKPEHLKIRRVRRGAGFAYVLANGRNIRERTLIRRLERLAVPPAYRETRFATNPRGQSDGTRPDASNTATTLNGNEYESCVRRGVWQSL